MVVIYVGAAVSDYESMQASLAANTIVSYGIEDTTETVYLTLAGKDAVMNNCIIPELTADEDTADVAEETEETAEETTDETPVDDGLPGSMIYACIDYDDERCIFIQINTLEAVTDEEAQTLVETVADAITIIER